MWRGRPSRILLPAARVRIEVLEDRSLPSGTPLLPFGAAGPGVVARRLVAPTTEHSPPVFAAPNAAAPRLPPPAGPATGAALAATGGIIVGARGGSRLTLEETASAAPPADSPGGQDGETLPSVEPLGEPAGAPADSRDDFFARLPLQIGWGPAVGDRVGADGAALAAAWHAESAPSGAPADDRGDGGSGPWSGFLAAAGVAALSGTLPVPGKGTERRRQFLRL
jgi:hypothetical protein